MAQNSTSELQELRKEVRRLRRYQRIVHGQLFASGKVARLLTFLWFGPDLTKAIRNLLSARKAGNHLSDLELAQLIAAIIRRMLRVGIIAILLAILPVAVLTWQNTLMREQVIESRTQTLEIVRYNRKSDVKRLLVEVEVKILGVIREHFGVDYTHLRQHIKSEEFSENCTNESTPEYRTVDSIVELAYPYVRLLSELYLLDTRVLDPLSGMISEYQVIKEPAATSADVYWLSYKVADAMAIVRRCRAREAAALYSFVLWSAEIDSEDYDRYMKPATRIKYRYDVAKRNVVVKGELVRGASPVVRVRVTNSNKGSFSRVVVHCLVAKSAPSQDLADKRRSIELLSNEDRELQISFSELRGQNLDDANAYCSIESAIFEGPGGG